MSAPSIATRWHIAEVERQAVRELSAALDVSPVVAALLRSRGIHAAEAGDAFLNPESGTLSDPSLLTDLDKAVDRLNHAKAKGERILVFGDYDVDGISGTALLVQAFARAGLGECSYALPNRLKEGYGLNTNAIKKAHAEGVSLVVTVDNGISAHAAAEEAKRCGIDLIVTDHHQIEDELPTACAVINPKRDGPESPFADICGAAVAFNLARGLTGDEEGLDLAALGTVADIVPLHGENRKLVARGLAELNRNPRPGITALCRVARIDQEAIRAENIAFHLGPRINAGGRMGDGCDGLELLLTDSPGEGRDLAQQLDDTNRERRRIENEILEDAKAELDAVFDAAQRTIVLARRGWHPGVIGIVASKLQHAYCRPVIMAAVDEAGIARASARSTPDFDIMAGLAATQDLLVRYGGHRAAAGLTIREKDLEAFKERFEAEAQRLMGPDERYHELDIDGLVSFSEIDGQLLHAIDRLEPYGKGNPSPVFATLGVRVMPNSLRELRGGHLRFSVQEGSRVFTAIAFGMADRLDEAPLPETVDIAFSPRFNTWNNQTTIQLQLKDFRAAEAP